MLVLAQRSRKVGLLEDVLQDSDKVSDVVGVSVVQQERYGGESALDYRRIKHRNSQDTLSLPGFHMLVTTNSSK